MTGKPMLDSDAERMLFYKIENDKNLLLVRYRSYEWKLGKYQDGKNYLEAINGSWHNFVQLEDHWDPNAALNTVKEKWTTQNEEIWDGSFARFEKRLAETYGENHYQIYAQDNVLRVVGKVEGKQHVIDFKSDRLYATLAEQALWFSEYFGELQKPKEGHQTLTAAGLHLGGYYANFRHNLRFPTKKESVRVTRVNVALNGESEVYFETYEGVEKSCPLKDFIYDYKKVKECHWFRKGETGDFEDSSL